ncbi:MAG: TetR/AcrR family transcriptional regulator [bacterium]|nr:TetR/AcrR family transcriptional regulator [bacterium]
MPKQQANRGAKGGGGARAPLTRARILESGLRLLERSPDSELSMRSLAYELGTAPMSLYRHVRNRDDLLEGINLLAFESIQLEIPSEGDWRERALLWMHSLRRELHAQPAVAPLLRLRGSLAPTLLQVLDTLARVMLDAGFEGRKAAMACREVAWFTMSFVSNEIRGHTEARKREDQTTSEHGSFEPLSTQDLSDTASLAALFPAFAEIGIDEIFSAAADHLLEGIARSLDASVASRPENESGGNTPR